jgi:hypothetical protein
MKNFGKLAVLGAALAVSATYASATPITGTLGTFTGSAAADVGSTSTVFDLTATGPITLATPGNPTLGNYTLSPVLDDFTASGGTITAAGGVLFSGTDNVAPGDSIQFIGTGYSLFSEDANGDYTIQITGYFTGADISNTAAVDNFQFNSGNASGNSGNSRSGEVTEQFVASTPEPSSLMLLGTGLMGGAGMLMRRRRQTV